MGLRSITASPVVAPVLMTLSTLAALWLGSGLVAAASTPALPSGPTSAGVGAPAHLDYEPFAYVVAPIRYLKLHEVTTSLAHPPA